MYSVWDIEDQEDYVQDHEIVLSEYSPEYILVENSTVLDVLKVSDMTMKLVEAIKLRLDSQEMNRYRIFILVVFWSFVEKLHHFNFDETNVKKEEKAFNLWMKLIFD